MIIDRGPEGGIYECGEGLCSKAWFSRELC